MSKLEDVQKWLSEKYKLDSNDAEYIVNMVIDGDEDGLIDTFITEGLENDPEEQGKVAKQVNNLLQTYKERFKSDRPRPKPKPLELVEAEASPQAKVPDEDDVHAAVAKQAFTMDDEKPAKKPKRRKGDTKGLTAAYKEKKPQLDDVSGNEQHATIADARPKSKSKRPEPEVQTTNLDAPPKYPPSHGMGVVQIRLLKKLVASVEMHSKGTVLFDQFNPDGGGIPLDEARAVFGTLLMRGGVCEVVDAIKVKKTGKKFWGKKVIPILPMAQVTIDDFLKRRPDKRKLIK